MDGEYFSYATFYTQTNTSFSAKATIKYWKTILFEILAVVNCYDYFVFVRPIFNGELLPISHNSSFVVILSSSTSFVSVTS